MTASVIADFRATIKLSRSDGDAGVESRLVMTEDRLRVVTDGPKQVIELDSIFDIVRGVSRLADADSTETVTLAFSTGNRRETVTIRTDAETLVKFQQLLYKELLMGTEVVVKRRRQSDDGADSAQACRLQVSADRIRLAPTDDSIPVSVPRADITRFGTSSDTGTSSVVLYAIDSDRVERISVRFSSFRLLNLFGRYLRADLLTVDSLGSISDDEGSIGVLLVDDDDDGRDLTEVFLTEQSDRLSIIGVSSAVSALDFLADERRAAGIDCVVSDYKMPQMDGISFLQAIREETQTLPFILYTGQGSKRVAKQAILDDVTDYVQKEVGPEQYKILVERIEKAVR